MWRKRRIPPRCNRSEPQKTRKADPGPENTATRVTEEATNQNQTAQNNQIDPDFFNGISPKQTRSLVTSRTVLCGSVLRTRDYIQRPPGNQSCANDSADQTAAGRKLFDRICSTVLGLPFGVLGRPFTQTIKVPLTLDLFPLREHILFVQIIAKSTLRAFWVKHPQSETPLKVWHVIVRKAEWSGPADVRTMFGASVNFVGDNRVIFNISGNKYRLIVHVAYPPYKRVLIKFIGTHAEYDKIDADTV